MSDDDRCVVCDVPIDDNLNDDTTAHHASPLSLIAEMRRLVPPKSTPIAKLDISVFQKTREVMGLRGLWIESLLAFNFDCHSEGN